MRCISEVKVILTFSISILSGLLVDRVGGDRFSGLCPPSYPRQVILNGTGKCHTVGSTGPCPAMMVVSADPNHRNFGYCQCKNLGTRCFGRPLLEWDDRCYFEFSQGPCKKGFWLKSNGNGFATCQKNPCPLVEDQKYLLRSNVPRKNFYFTLDDSSECHLTGTQALCEEGYRVYFLGSERFPRCLRDEPWTCEHYSSPSAGQSLLRQGHASGSFGFGVPYDGI